MWRDEALTLWYVAETPPIHTAELVLHVPLSSIFYPSPSYKKAQMFDATKRLLHFLFLTRCKVATSKDFQAIPRCNCKVLSGFDENLPVLYFYVLTLLLFPKQTQLGTLMHKALPSLVIYNPTHFVARDGMDPNAGALECCWHGVFVWDHKENTCGFALALFSLAHFLDELAMSTCRRTSGQKVFLLSFEE
jgi:hypothetical protein